MINKRKPIDPGLAREWSDWAQITFMDALVQSAPWTCNQIAFHGGTSLHLSWNSPRFSEDLDFLLLQEKSKDFDLIMSKVRQKMQSAVMLFDPSLTIEIKNKSKEESNLLSFHIVLSSPKKIIGNTMVKAEFWKVDSEYLDKYESEFVLPVKRNDVVSRISQPIPAATLKSAYADKLTAFSTRPFLKWRDVFDLWWIGKQIDINPAEMSKLFLHHVSAYNTVDNKHPKQALLQFLSLDIEDVVKKSDPDLKKWLPAPLWNALYPDGVRQMVMYTRDSLSKISDQIDRNEIHVSPKNRPHKAKKIDINP